ncbi:MAG TPA: GNAT family N-acetyltransferase [Polyangiaceae bacterium]|nr:GNAT family N-acetyltransferase [Polyangiaceae bacterium]
MPSSTLTDASVCIDLVRDEEYLLLANLLELYLHDLSETFAQIQLGPDGRFGYPWLESYWTEREKRFPFLIRQQGKVTGFALAQRGSPLSDDPEVFDVAEFFVLRSERRSGVGARAATLLWERFAGRWIVRVAEGNRAGLPFWTRVIHSYAGDAASQTVRGEARNRFRVFAFDTQPHVDPGAR